VRSPTILLALLALLALPAALGACRFDPSAPAGFVLDGSTKPAEEDAAPDRLGDQGQADDGVRPADQARHDRPGADRLIVDQALPDQDGDEVADDVDNCPTKPNADQADGDQDGVGDLCDNCSGVSNPDQADLDTDGFGNLCDPDRDGDLVPNDLDFRPDTKDDVYYWYPNPKPPRRTVPGDFSSNRPWATTTGAFCSSILSTGIDSTMLAYLMQSKLAQTNYTVETIVDVNKVGPTAGPGYPAAGLALRVDLGGTKYYVCSLDLKGKRLVLGKREDMKWSELSDAAAGVQVPGTFKLHATAKGDQLTCTLVGGPTVSKQDNQLKIGTVGFSAYAAEACFMSLVVTAPPP